MVITMVIFMVIRMRHLARSPKTSFWRQSRASKKTGFPAKPHSNDNEDEPKKFTFQQKEQHSFKEKLAARMSECSLIPATICDWPLVLGASLAQELNDTGVPEKDAEQQNKTIEAFFDVGQVSYGVDF